MIFLYWYYYTRQLKLKWPKWLTVSMQILQHSWLERHLTIFWQKVHFLGQILDYKGQIMSKFELNGTKKPSTEIRTAPFYLCWYGINYHIMNWISKYWNFFILMNNNEGKNYMIGFARNQQKRAIGSMILVWL